ncbi:MAG: acetate kinase [Chthoniobacterales bacterium]
MPDAPLILVINSGSSSLKFAVKRAHKTLATGVAERLGSPQATLESKVDGKEGTTPIPDADHTAALRAVTSLLGESLKPTAIGHRVVHGGEFFAEPALIDADVLARINSLSRLAPLHNPAAATGIRTTLELFPGIPQVAVFDTAFHQTIPARAHLYAIPYDLYEAHAIRRYGFHGTSHHYVSLRAAAILGTPPNQVSLLTVHLGNGCSATAIRHGESVDTTMGLTPLEGLVMGTRSGDVDPNLHQFLAENTGLDLPEITNLLNKESGLLGLSGLSNDLRTLSQAAEEGNTRAALAIDVFCYRLAKSLLGLSASLDRIDAIVFTGGIGENSVLVREKTTAHLAILGAKIDANRNLAHGRDSDHRISPENANPPLLVIHTDEEGMIAQAAVDLLAARKSISHS